MQLDSSPLQRDELVAIRRTRDGHTLEVQDGLTRQLVAALEAVVEGEIRFDRGSRGAYASDASNYHMTPLGVVVPRSADDVERAMAVCRRFEVPVLSRGGGTSLAGQCVNVGVVIDYSKYMRQIIEIDPERRLARVQPGVVLDDLREAASRYGLTFGPDTSTHDRCTIGGMIGNNACGSHAIMAEFYGPGPRTEHNVAELEVLTYDGVRMRVGETSDEAFAAAVAEGGRKAEIYQQLRTLRDRYERPIREQFPDIQRQVSGYNLPALLRDNSFNLARALVGTEATCVTVLEATVHLIPAKPERTLVVLGYPSVYEAGDHVTEIRQFRPTGLEGIDSRLLACMRAKGMHEEYLEYLPEGGGWLLVEFGGDSRDEAEGQADAMCEMLAAQAHPPSMKRFVGDDGDAIWEIRESGLGATAFAPGEPDTWPGWEDAAVAPDQVGPYLRDFRQLLNEYGYECSLYGHFGQGCIHTRIDFALHTQEGRGIYERFTRDAADLIGRYGGSLSGEHGDGQARGELLSRMFGPDLMKAFHEFKEIWDPSWKMNPGKVIDAFSRTEDLRLREYQPPALQTYFSYPEDNGQFSHAAIRCVGVGKCRATESGTMCPSYMVTLEEEHSTRGRARLLYEMLQGDVVADGWASEAVKDSLDLCLSCKGCKSDCPVSVDMATYKAEFLAHYYEHHPRPRQAYAFGWIHRWAAIGGCIPELVNFVSQTPGLRDLAKLIAGVAPQRSIPKFASRTFKSRFRRRKPGVVNRDRRVVLWPDTFNNHFFPSTLESAVSVLEHAGYQVVVPEQRLCCGRALYDYGMIDLAKQLWGKTFAALGSEIDRGTPVVGMEPSCVAAFRDELPNLFPADERAIRLSKQTHTLAEFLTEVVDDYAFPKVPIDALVQGHCHHKSIMGMEADEKVYRAMDLQASVPDSGCCGMAGAFGFERGTKYDVSMAAGERRILPAVRSSSPDTLIMADGFSCREQIMQATDIRPFHLAEVLHIALQKPKLLVGEF